MKYGYARVSTVGQNLETQILMLKDEQCQKIYCEKYTGTTTKRPEFEGLLLCLKPGDTLVATKLDRFARNTKEALEVIQYLFDKNIKIHILNMGIIEDTPTGRLMFTMISAFAQFERDLIITRTQEGKELAKKKNPNYREGRKNLYTAADIKRAHDYLQQGLAITEISRQTGISKSTLYRRFKHIKKEANQAG